jgi:TonB family protein
VLRVAVAVVLLLLAAPFGATAAAQDSIAAARDLYTTADYREALAMLTRLRPSAASAADVRAIEQYRAFSLIALGQIAEAELVVEQITAIDPTWTLPADEAPPRIVTLFAQARERALPNVLRQRIAAARALYAEKSYDAAAEAFTSVLLMLEDPSMARAAGADLQSMTALATGFRDLSLAAGEQARAAATREAAATPVASAGALDGAALPPAGSALPTPGAPATGAPATGTGTGTPGTETGGATPAAPASDTPAPTPETSSGTPAPDTAPDTPADTGATPAASSAAPAAEIVPPIAIAQAIPRATENTVPLGGPQTILLDIVIDETGHVERAEVKRSVNRLYEAQLVAATRGWRYQPATQGGRPVKYARTLEVTLNPRE